MKNIYIIYRNFLNKDLKTVSVGGIQTYLLNLCDVIQKIGASPIICQISERNFESTYGDIKVFGFVANDKTLSKIVVKTLNLSSQPVIFGSHELIINYSGPSIAIQHGITWDTPVHSELSGLKNQLYTFQRARMSFRLLQQISKVDHLVCVDYNFVNWYRTQVAHPDIDMTVVPNFADSQNKLEKPSDFINIIFARRLFWYRGTRLMLEVMDELLHEYSNIRITIAGSGPDESLFVSKYAHNNRVEIIHYRSDESYKIHSDKHIAVVPTLGSEGTSLSLLEAMASHCAVVCTNVGGMTNIVIDGFNGLVINPDKDSLKKALVHLIENKDLRMRIAERGFDTVNNGFSLKLWKEKWYNIIKFVFNL